MSRFTLRYYVEESYSKRLYNAGILRKEHEKILALEGYRPIQLLPKGLPGLLLQLVRLFQVIWCGLFIPRGSQVIFHFPLLAGAYHLLLRILNFRGIQTTAIIIDIEGLRCPQSTVLHREIRQLRRFRSLIVHNSRMAGWLCTQLPDMHAVSIELFDHCGSVNQEERIHELSVCFAGNLGKAGFIHQLSQLTNIQFHLYGEGIAQLNSAKNIKLHGPQPPETLTAIIKGAYGLIWEGNRMDLCDEYLQYNTPHKTSLYLLAGLPLIVWKQSALSDWVEQQQVGLTVNNLHELAQVLAAVRQDQYLVWRNNVLEKGRELSTGRQLLHALKQLEQAY